MQKLFQSPTMIVKGEYYEYPFRHYDSKGEYVSQEMIPTALIDFTFQVNGRLVTFSHNFELEKNTETGREISLKQWESWHLLMKALGFMGYTFDRNDFEFSNGPMQGWLDELYESYLDGNTDENSIAERSQQI